MTVVGVDAGVDAGTDHARDIEIGVGLPVLDGGHLEDVSNQDQLGDGEEERLGVAAIEAE